MIRPSFSLATGGLNVTAPSNPNIAPPGYYMLFILNGSGVPSVAKIIQISGSGPPTPTPTPTPYARCSDKSHRNSSVFQSDKFSLGRQLE